MQRPTLILLVLALAVGAAQAEDKYQRKSGLWELTRSSTQAGAEPRTYQMCIEQASNKALSQLLGALRSEHCDTSKVARSGDTLTVDAVCTIEKGRTKATTHAVVTGKFDSAYTVESKSTFDPARRGKTEATSVLKAKWLSACKPGQRPGDLL
ncbi:MAG TPA: DUF3617 family protein, partial [Actinomycetota bacterium]|nr:DUF3617 family protein [Actinomycetota bacterium]